jgi:hypothetical protein
MGGIAVLNRQMTKYSFHARRSGAAAMSLVQLMW